jgi:FtsP/CotA-like multicopper oxidase with cupredoxin domain
LLEAKRGDEVVVHFRNELEQDGTSVHHHGLRLPEEMDGAHQVLLPGESFDYRFIAKDAGTFWYHPHVNADMQIERGLYGPVHIREGASPRSAAERILVLDDVKLAENGDLAGEWTELDIALGRQGNRVLVNGAVTPKIEVISGSRERWHLVNAANGRFFQLDLAGQPFEVIGWDGGLIEVPYTTQTLLIAPGERYDVLVRIADPPGKLFDVQSLPYDRGNAHPGPASTETVFHIEVTGGTPLDAGPPTLGVVDPLPLDDTTAVRPFVLTEDVHGKYGPEFLINGEFWPFQTPIEATLGHIEIWDIHNDAEGDHPFHLHGMFFQVLSRNGIQEERLGWKDTVLVPRKSVLRFAVHYDEPGMWMYHCQIPEHAERGMMGEVMVYTAGLRRPFRGALAP